VSGENHIMRSFALFYSSPNIIRVTKCEVGGHIEGIGEKRDACRLLMKKPEGKN
jgi:hypothetical protein